ncbi:MAG: Asp-tRNA(Asn)/Glu-tRNA(Gln) amidotransferase subunit GatB [Bacteroidota bacterium]|jgi:aspartyl-tRNA(Asn)/glutamyl-tRNA(Gln) amidotransferase subunit B
MTHKGYEAVIGLEVHVQLSTRSKAYAGEGYGYGEAPNTQISPVSLGLPGALPRANWGVVQAATRLGLALGCTIREYNEYARKNYFYPDLTKGYQITQHETPICNGGHVAIETSAGPKRIGLTRIHMEEDTGKSIHDLDPFHTLLDYNRAGVPLLEIVSEPDLRNGEEAYAYLNEIRQLVRYLDISDGNMEEGSLRCDVNISVRPVGQVAFGTKVEVKNLNSFRHVQKAIDFEFQRQVAAVEAGEVIYQETRTFDSGKGSTSVLRLKEDANDYRYFTEPDLAPVRLTPAWIEGQRSSLPELPRARKARYQDQLGLSEYDAQLLTEDKATAAFFDALCAAGAPPKTAANWITGPVAGWLNERASSIDRLPVAAASLAALIGLIEARTVSHSAAQQIFVRMAEEPNAQPKALAEKMGLVQESNEDALMAVVDSVLADWPEKVAEYQSGKKGLIGLFMGEVMKRSRGSADPKVATDLLRRRLD